MREVTIIKVMDKNSLITFTIGFLKAKLHLLLLCLFARPPKRIWLPDKKDSVEILAFVN